MQIIHESRGMTGDFSLINLDFKVMILLYCISWQVSPTDPFNYAAGVLDGRAKTQMQWSVSLLLLAPGHSSFSGSLVFSVTSTSAKTEVPCLFPGMRQWVLALQDHQHDAIINYRFRYFPWSRIGIQPQDSHGRGRKWLLMSTSSFKTSEFEYWCPEAGGPS